MQWADSLWNGTALRTTHCHACHSIWELTLQVVTGSRKQTAPFIPLTCTVLRSPRGRSHSQTAFCWSQELVCSIRHKGFCSTVLRSPAHVCSPETILSASLDVSALISCGSDGNPTHAEQETILRSVLVTINSTTVHRIALLLPAQPSICSRTYFRTVCTSFLSFLDLYPQNSPFLWPLSRSAS